MRFQMGKENISVQEIIAGKVWLLFKRWEKKLATAKSLILHLFLFVKGKVKNYLQYGNMQYIPSERPGEELYIISFR